MNKPIIKKLENRKAEIEGEISRLDSEKRNLSRRISEIQVMIIGLTGERNAIEDVIKELKLEESNPPQ
jgi:chaperonin cofactor prefoldin